MPLALVVIMTPGPDTALTIPNTISGGRRAGIGTAVGVSSGWPSGHWLSAAGVAALLVASEPAFMALKYAGAAYLVLLGLQTLAEAFRPRVREPAKSKPRRSPLTPRAALRQGLINDLANPKIAVFFSSLLPQFAPADGPVFPVLLALGRAIDALMGTVLVALGGRLALERR